MSAQQNQLERGYESLLMGGGDGEDDDSNDEDEADKGDEKGEIKHQDENEGEK